MIVFRVTRAALPAALILYLGILASGPGAAVPFLQPGTADAPTRLEAQAQVMLDIAADVHNERKDCPGGIQIDTRKLRTYTEDGQERMELGKAPVGGCVMWINAEAFGSGGMYGEHTLCVTVVHEYGHLLARTFDNPADPYHSTDPYDVMYSQANTIDIPECDRYSDPGGPLSERPITP